jgi:hypothetical protein
VAKSGSLVMCFDPKVKFKSLTWNDLPKVCHLKFLTKHFLQFLKNACALC